MTSKPIEEYNLSTTVSPDDVNHWQRCGEILSDKSDKLRRLVQFASSYDYNIEDLSDMRWYAESILLATSDLYEDIKYMIAEIDAHEEQGFYEKRDAQD